MERELLSNIKKILMESNLISPLLEVIQCFIFGMVDCTVFVEDSAKKTSGAKVGDRMKTLQVDSNLIW